MTDPRAIPSAPGGLPLAGHLVRLLRDPLTFLTSLPAHGDLVRIRLGPLPVVVLCDAELTRRVLTDDRVFDKGGPVYDRAREVAGNGLPTCPYSAHRRQRRMLQPAFRPARLAAYADVMTDCIDERTAAWQAGQVLSVQTEMMAIASKAAAAAFFSRSLPPAELDRILGDVTTLINGMGRRMLLIPPLDRLPTRGNRSYLRARARLRGTLDQIVAQRLSQGTDRGDLLSALIRARDTEGDGRGMSSEEVGDQTMAFFLAGTETTAATVSWALDLLARHPEVEQRVHREVDTVLDGAAAAHRDLPDLPLTARVVKETLRMRPPGWFITRSVSADAELGGHLLRAGTTVAYSAYLVHHRRDLYDDPEAFDPDRWDPGRPQPPRHALIPFAAGARRCIGDAFATTEATLALATITARWRLAHLTVRRTRPALAMTLRPRDLRMRARPR
ncbi:cytochrome P450 [Streptomyces fragilis]|uniref:Cytochrome P450 n=1 Tax=Streptomyces fragilis TaxID=67301 RepID=A0ABV2YCD9_9ACTN|nr:cytochrome P450 [Streptomyces fragilis]